MNVFRMRNMVNQMQEDYPALTGSQMERLAEGNVLVVVVAANTSDLQTTAAKTTLVQSWEEAEKMTQRVSGTDVFRVLSLGAGFQV